MNTNPDFLIWGEHNGFLRHIAKAYYDAAHPLFPDKLNLSAAERIKRLRVGNRWPAWDNLSGEAEFEERFRAFIRSFFADPAGRATRWGFKEIRYGQDAQDNTLRLMFDCFPETRLIVLIREPEPTIFSILSRWVFADRRRGNIDLHELDQQILSAARSWNAQYMHLHALVQNHAPGCFPVRYEDLRSPDTYRNLSRFLATPAFDYRKQIGKVKDTANRTDPTAVLIERRIKLLEPHIASATNDAREAYGYSSRAPREDVG